MIAVPPLDRDLEPRLRQLIDSKAKPLGALGRIEEIALHIGLVTNSLKPDLGRAALVVFAGDHGVVAEGVTAYPSDVSAMVGEMMLEGVAGANIAASAVGAEFFLVDAGLKRPLASHPRLLNRFIRRGTRNFLHESAMTEEEAQKAFETGIEIVRELNARGFGLFALGEIGIGNSSSAALVAHAVAGLPLAMLVGNGAGIPPLGLQHKRDVLARAFARAPVRAGFDALREFGGYEMLMLAGAMIACAANRAIALVDGFIATAAACAAMAIAPTTRDHLLFGHLSPEAGHACLLEWLGARPLLDLGMRLGEGTGAALAIPLVRMAEAMLRDMASLPGSHPARPTD
jgi:nicotinate-nucleotide--dimethylbenzimidazole phosphoribosyltransferase